MTTLKHPGTTPRAIGDGVPRSGWHLFFHPFLEYDSSVSGTKRRPAAVEKGNCFPRLGFLGHLPTFTAAPFCGCISPEAQRIETGYFDTFSAGAFSVCLVRQEDHQPPKQHICSQEAMQEIELSNGASWSKAATVSTNGRHAQRSGKTTCPKMILAKNCVKNARPCTTCTSGFIWCFFADVKLFFLWLMLFNQALWDCLAVVCS